MGIQLKSMLQPYKQVNVADLRYILTEKLLGLYDPLFVFATLKAHKPLQDSKGIMCHVG